ncbi:MAG: MarR family transcriptional regulator [bacterium]|nr:MAG: MarR family transcriptional regulator [bacterium]
MENDPIHTIALLYPRLMRAMSHLRGVVDGGMDLSYNQYKALLSLSDIGPCTLNALSRDLGVATSSASQMIDRLLIMGLVRRGPGDGDRRQVELRTTEDGEALLKSVGEGILLRYRELFEHLSPSEQANLAGAIHTLVRILERASRDREEGG